MQNFPGQVNPWIENTEGKNNDAEGKKKIKIQVLWILVRFIQNRSLYFVLPWTSACIIFIQFVTSCCLYKKKIPTHKQTNRKTPKPNSNNPKTQTRKLEKTVSLFSVFTQSCATLNFVVFSSSHTADTVSNQDGCHYGTHDIYCWHFQPCISGSAFVFLW